jgi:hypothetical protein
MYAFWLLFQPEYGLAYDSDFGFFAEKTKQLRAINTKLELGCNKPNFLQRTWYHQ